MSIHLELAPILSEIIGCVSVLVVSTLAGLGAWERLYMFFNLTLEGSDQMHHTAQFAVAIIYISKYKKIHSHNNVPDTLQTLQWEQNSPNFTHGSWKTGKFVT